MAVSSELSSVVSSFQSASHPTTFASSVLNLPAAGIFADVDVAAARAEFSGDPVRNHPVHSVVLAAYSPVLSETLDAVFDHSPECRPVILFPGVDAGTVKALVHFLYNGRVCASREQCLVIEHLLKVINADVESSMEPVLYSSESEKWTVPVSGDPNKITETSPVQISTTERLIETVKSESDLEENQGVDEQPSPLVGEHVDSDSNSHVDEKENEVDMHLVVSDKVPKRALRLKKSKRVKSKVPAAHNGRSSSSRTGKKRSRRCKLCGVSFPGVQELRDHLKTVHKHKNRYRCSICATPYATPQILEDHMNSHRNVKAHTCSICSAAFFYRRNLFMHTKKHELGDNYVREKKHSCPYCAKMFADSRNMMTHVRTHTGERPYECESCFKKFADATTLRRHKVMHTGAKPFACDLCEAKFTRRASLQYHMRNHRGERHPPSSTQKKVRAPKLKSENTTPKIDPTTGEKTKLTFCCETCGKQFKQRNILKDHQNVHLQVSPYLCEICSRCFHYKSVLKFHMRKKHGIPRPYTKNASHQCPICQKSFSEKANMKVHYRLHTGERPFVCEICKKSFRASNTLRTHQITHTGEKPFKCSFQNCSNSYTDRSGLRKHKLTHEIVRS